MRREQTSIPDFSAVRGRRILIALSGGADSVALAVMLAEAREAYALTLFAAHVDHGIRPESAEDAAFCRDLCGRLEIPFFCERVDVPVEASRNQCGLETAARNCRFTSLMRILDETRSDFIALAHHMDDQAETVLMHLARGAGVEGVRGMRTLTGNSRLYRPLLNWRKADLTEFLRKRSFSWREDATNRIADNPRNGLRLNVIPEIEKWYPQFVPAVARFARTAQIESDLLDALTADYLSAASSARQRCAWLSLDPLPHPAILRRAIRALCPEVLGWEQINALEALCARSRGKLDLGASVFAERTGRRLYFVRKRPLAIEPVALSLRGETYLAPLGTITASPCPPVPVMDDPFRQVLNAQVLNGAVLRTRREGDRIRPLGGGDKLLSDFFIDKKVDRPLRDATPLVAVANRVHWVIGHAISQEAAIKPGEDAVMLKYKDQFTTEERP